MRIITREEYLTTHPEDTWLNLPWVVVDQNNTYCGAFLTYEDAVTMFVPTAYQPEE